MTHPLHILFVAPSAPPKNTPEAIQVRRLLSQLDTMATGRLVTVQATGVGTWAQVDRSMELPLKAFDVHTLVLPLHRFMSRLLSSHRLKFLHVPDAYFWLPLYAGAIIRKLEHKPDILYTRAQPMSVNLLGMKLKKKLGIPWVMHWSDPWVDNPYGKPAAREQAQERMCIAAADYITFTTEGQAEHHRQKYPEHAYKMGITPNFVPNPEEFSALTASVKRPEGEAPVRMVFAGSLYGRRSPEPLVRALQWLQEHSPETLKNLRVDVYGNMQPEARHWLAQAPEILRYHGPIPFAQSCAEQCAADIGLVIEPEKECPMDLHFLPSKTLDSLVLVRKMLAIISQGSETDRICKEGYGWSVSPSDVPALAACIHSIVANRHVWRNEVAKAAPERYQAASVAKGLLEKMQGLVKRQA